LTSPITNKQKFRVKHWTITYRGNW